MREQHLKELNGTFLYLPPEMIEHNTYSLNLDVWSMGLIGYIMIFRSHPCKDDSIEKMLKKRAIGKLSFPKFTERKAVIMRNIIITCLEGNPIKRAQIETIHQQLMKV